MSVLPIRFTYTTRSCLVWKTPDAIPTYLNLSRQRITRPSQPPHRCNAAEHNPPSPAPGQPPPHQPPGSGGETQPPSSPKPSTPSATFLSQAQGFIVRNCLPLALTSAMALGVVQPSWGAAVAAGGQLQTYIVMFIFILSGLQLKQGEAFLALKSTGSVAYGLVSILLLSPMLAPLVLALPLQPPALSLGLAVFISMPTALSSGIAMTQAVGGNVAMAILLTVSSNLLAVVTLPLLLPLLLGSAAGGLYLDPWVLLRQLVCMVLLPTLAGALARAYVPGAAKAVDNNRPVVACLSALCLAAVPWMQVSKAMLKGAAKVSVPQLAAAAACGVSIHIVLLIANAFMAKLLKLGGTEDPTAALGIQQAVVLLASQKTLPVAVTLLGQLAPMLGEAAGLAAMATVFAHLAQILVDSFLVSLWVKNFGRISDQRAKLA